MFSFVTSIHDQLSLFCPTWCPVLKYCARSSEKFLKSSLVVLERKRSTKMKINVFLVTN